MPLVVFGKSSRPDRRDVAREQLVRIGNALADQAFNLGGIDPVALGAFDLLNDHERIAAFIGEREGRTAIWAESGMQCLRRPFDILRIVVDAPDDDDILYPAGDEQFAGLIEVAGVPDPQPVRVVIVPGQDP